MGRYKLLNETRSRSRDWQLFDLQTDVGETSNLAAAKPELVRRLQIELTRWEKEARADR